MNFYFFLTNIFKNIHEKSTKEEIIEGVLVVLLLTTAVSIELPLVQPVVEVS